MMKKEGVKVSQFSPEVLQKVRDQVYELSGISLAGNKESLIETRLRRRLRATGVADPSEYLRCLNSSPEELEQFVNVFTTNETSFFRTVRVWRYIENELFANWAKESSVVRHAWSAASSSGEEAYSLAMANDKFNQESESKVKLRILGSDISTEEVAKARAAVYQGRTINRLKASRPDALLSYFVERNEELTLRPNIKGAVSFKQHNLYSKPPFIEHYDLVMLRNVLIYFTDKDQEKVLSNIYRSLKIGGILIVGESETLNNLETSFDFCEPLIYQKTKGN